MCGRFVVSYTYDELMRFLGDTFDIFEGEFDFQVPRYNIAPGQQVISVIGKGTEYRVGTLRWGLVPSFASDEKIGYKMINARSETLLQKPSFASLVKTNRCVILADGFYEWKKTDGNKEPMFIYLNNHKMFLFAGLWSAYKKADGTMLYTTTIITTKANEMMANIHDRMPVILTTDDAKKWLHSTVTDAKELLPLLQQYDSDKMAYHQVDSIVNNAKNDFAECILPITKDVIHHQELFKQ